jgi:2-hydroxychromene-2-carboxylate isomerase
MRPIDFYFDFASPYGFIAAMQIDRVGRPVMAALPARLNLQGGGAIGARASTQARVRDRSGRAAHGPPAGPAVEGARRLSGAFAAASTRVLLDRATTAHQSYRVRESRLSGYWLHGCPTSDAKVALDVAVSVGYDRQAVSEGMQEREIKSRLVLENEEAIRRGVFGSPFFLAEGERFWGSDRMSMLPADPTSASEAPQGCPLE